MANTYTWNFPTLERKATEGDLSDVVKTIHYRYTGTYDSNTEISSTIYGTVGLDQPDSNTFITFDSLTANTVKTWVLTKLNQTEIELKASIDSQNDTIVNPSLIKGLPSNW